MKIYSIAQEKFFEVVPKKTTGEEDMLCPVCNQDRKKKNSKPFRWNHDKGCGICHHCQEKFATKQEKPEPKIYHRPVFNNRTELSDKLVKYFQGRGISQQTLLDLKITEGPEWMPQTGKQENTIQFNYFRNSQLINTKFRDGKKNFKLVKDAELVFYNLDSALGATSCIITEGEMDCLSWIEAGFKNVLSVPNGAATGKMEYIENCLEYFSSMDTILLSTDSDGPGQALRDELARRLGVERCYKIDFGELKDANEYLVYHGKEKLADLTNSVKEFPLQGVYTVDETWPEIENIYYNGLPNGCKTGDHQMDGHMGFMPGELTMVTGIPGHGKSIYLDQLSLGLAINSGWKFAVFSPESYPLAFYFTRIMKRLVGKKFSKNNISLSQLEQARTWLREKYFLVLPEDGSSLTEILATAKRLVQRKGINCLIIDPWNRIEHNLPKGITEGQYIVKCLTSIIEFAQRSGVHVFLVAHPTKMQKEKDGINYVVPNLYNISGSAHFFNIAHNGFTVYRNNTTAKTEVHIQKVKWEHLGKIGMMEYHYNADNARFDNTLHEDNSNWFETKIYPNTTQTSIDDVLSELLPGNEPPF